MSINYDTGDAGIFTRSGKIIAKSNSYNATATTTYPADLKAIADLFEAADLTGQIAGLYADYGRFQDDITGIRQTLATYVDAVFTDEPTVIDQIPGLLATDIQSVLPALFDQMVRDAETIDASTVTVGSCTPASTNSGTGTFLTTKVLDGFNPPIQGAKAHLGYNTLDSQLSVPSETMTMVCTRDTNRDGAIEGGESFSWSGGIPGPPFDWENEASGQGPEIRIANSGYSIVTDGDFENWTNTNTPSNWDIDNGTAGTHILREATNFYRGTYSMRFAGTGAAATIGVSQTISSTQLHSRQRYCVGVRIKASAVPAAGQIEMHFAGTNYTKTSPTPEVQDIQISGTPTSGTYTISVIHRYGGTLTTAAIAYNATSATVQAALRLLSGLECVVVATQAGSPPDVTHRVTFRGVQGDIALATVNIASLTGGTPAQSVTQVTAGVEGDCVVLPAAGFPTGWHLAYFFINTPSIIPANWELVLQVTSTLSNTVNLYWDSLALPEIVYHGGIGIAGMAGATQFIVGDRFTFTLANDDTGIFQSYARKAWKFQLPSNSAGAETISDALAS